MSRQGQLPPRCPFKKTPSSHPAHNTISISPTNVQSHLGHHKSSFQSSIPEEEDEQSWVDDLLSDPNVNSNGNFHRRSASDSVTLVDGIVDSFAGLNPANGERDLMANETCNRLESACIYGPHSPRKRNNSTFLGNALALAFSECIPQKPLKCAQESTCVSGVTHSDSREDACQSLDVPSDEIKTSKRLKSELSTYFSDLFAFDFNAMIAELDISLFDLICSHVASKVNLYGFSGLD